jgi:large conductance mechanosensitive channel
MGMIQEFKKFALRGNVVDMAVGIIIGGAFGTIVKSLVSDIIMPPVGILTGGVNFNDWHFTLREAHTTLVDGVMKTTPPVMINIGVFINNVITFLIVAWSVFLVIKAMNVAESKLRRGEEAPADAPPPPEEVLLLRQIRDSLQKS